MTSNKQDTGLPEDAEQPPPRKGRAGAEGPAHTYPPSPTGKLRPQAKVNWVEIRRRPRDPRLPLEEAGLPGGLEAGSARGALRAAHGAGGILGDGIGDEVHIQAAPHQQLPL